MKKSKSPLSNVQLPDLSAIFAHFEEFAVVGVGPSIPTGVPMITSKV